MLLTNLISGLLAAVMVALGASQIGTVGKGLTNEQSSLQVPQAEVWFDVHPITGAIGSHRPAGAPGGCVDNPTSELYCAVSFMLSSQSSPAPISNVQDDPNLDIINTLLYQDEPK